MIFHGLANGMRFSQNCLSLQGMEKIKYLLYILALILFVGGCLLLLYYREAIFAYLDANFGGWGTAGILLLFCLVFWIIKNLLNL